MKAPIIISLCDYSGHWPRFYREAGYDVRCFDLKKTGDVRLLEHFSELIFGLLAAPPCTEFSGSGAQYWKAKDADGRTLSALSIVDACLRIVALHPELQFWALENPVGRLRRWIGKPAMMFNPCDYGGWMNEGETSCELAPPQDAYTKKTLLWGKFNAPAPKPVVPVFVTGPNGDNYSPIHWNTGGKSERTKTLRSMTPLGFAKAFYEANKAVEFHETTCNT
jgi:hypothetical protein